MHCIIPSTKDSAVVTFIPQSYFVRRKETKVVILLLRIVVIGWLWQRIFNTGIKHFSFLNVC